jgi:hypothetical protein
MGHPLIRAAVEEARRASDGPITVQLAAPGGPQRLSPGTRGRIRVVKVRYAGFEGLEELLAVAVTEGDPTPLPEEQARALLLGPAKDVGGFDVAVDEEDLDDAVKELLFTGAEVVSDREQERFSRAVEQIETSVEDRVLLLERRRADAVARVAEAEQRREAAVGAEARTRAEKRLQRREAALEEIEAELERLKRREDEDYLRWMEGANERRSRPPTVETLLDIRFELVGADE